MRRGAKEVVQTPILLPRLAQYLGDELLAEEMAWQALGWAAQEIRMAEPALQHRFQAATLHGVFAAGIEPLAAAGRLPDEGVEQHVTGPSLKTLNLLDAAAAGKKDEPGQAAQVERHAGFVGVMEEQEVGKSYEWRSLTARGHIAGTKVVDRGNAGAFRNNRRHAEGQGGRKATLGIMPDRVTRAADALRLVQREAGPVGNL